MRYLILLFCVFFSTVSLSQENNQDNSSNALGFFNKVKDSMSIENFQFDVNKLKFFGIENDTILLDTSLNINKYYQFNYRKKDNFEFLKFNNIGQVYNKLSYSPNNNFLPKIGFSANKMLLIGQEDYKFYDVAYPLTELFFKTVYSQGQLTDALFTTNINKYTNFLLAFKALRSLGKYQNSLSGWASTPATKNSTNPGLTTGLSGQELFADSYYNLEIDGSVGSPSGAVDVNGNLTVNSNQSIDMGSNALSVSGDITNSGTLTLTSNTTTLDGASSQYINSNTTFNNFIRIIISIFCLFFFFYNP